MRGCDKSDMLTHLYKIPLRARRWYVKIFGYVIDFCITNVIHRVEPMCLKQFRLRVSTSLREKTVVLTRANRSLSNLNSSLASSKLQMVPTSRTSCSNDIQHMPIFTEVRQTCKYCSKKNDIHRSRWMQYRTLSK